jgi:hypothetical protein
MTTPSMPDGHAIEVAQRLNDAYYGASPAVHFRTRAELLMRMGDGLGEGAELERQGPMSSEVLQRLPGVIRTYAPANELGAGDRRQGVLAVESFMLAHHAGEALLRNFLAHVDGRPSIPPWLALVASQGSSFRKRVCGLTQVSDDTLHSLVGWAFLGDREFLVATTGEEVVTAAEAHCARWLRHFSKFHLDTAPGYNAAKHGLSSIPGNARVSFLPVPSHRAEDRRIAEIVLLEGATLETLEYERNGNQRVWFRVTRTVDPPGLIATVLIAAELLGSLWTVGRARNLGGGAQIDLASRPSPDDIIGGHGKAWGAVRVPLAVLPLETEEADKVLQDLDVVRECRSPDSVLHGTGGVSAAESGAPLGSPTTDANEF